MKKSISLLLLITMAIGFTVSALAEQIPPEGFSQRFQDVPLNHEAFSVITVFAASGIIDGYGDGTFRPDNAVTRAEWAKIMAGAAGLPADDFSIRFSDIAEGHWSIPYVNAAADYLTAYSDGSYRPGEAALREDVAVAIVKLNGYDASKADRSYLSMFSDAETISESARDYVAIAVEMGIIAGFEDGTFRSRATLTRAQAAVMLWRVFLVMAGSGDSESPTGGGTDSNEGIDLGGVSPGTETDVGAGSPDNDLEIVLSHEMRCVVLGELMQASLMNNGYISVLMVVDSQVFDQLIADRRNDAFICSIDIIDEINEKLGETAYLTIPCIEKDGITLCIAVNKDAEGLAGILEDALLYLNDSGAIDIVLDYWDS